MFRVRCLPVMAIERVVMVLCLLGGTSGAIEPTYPPPLYSLVFHDDFSGPRLDEQRWMYRTDVKLDSSQRPENVFLRDGRLVIALRKESHRGKSYTGGGVISRAAFRYGYFEARVKMHGGAGWHQSVWAMYADPSTTYPARMRTEIDGIEFDSDLPTKGHMGLIRWRGPAQSRSSTCTPGVYRGPLGFDATAGFHNYGFEWTEREVRFFVDGDLRCVLPYPPEENEHDRINLWLTAIAYQRLAGKWTSPVCPARCSSSTLPSTSATCTWTTAIRSIRKPDLGKPSDAVASRTQAGAALATGRRRPRGGFPCPRQGRTKFRSSRTTSLWPEERASWRSALRVRSTGSR
jgi:hypothetical protein